MGSPKELLTILQLPLEIRLQIYSYLLAIPAEEVIAKHNLVSLPDYHIYEKGKEETTKLGKVLSFRNDAPPHFSPEKHMRKRRTTYKIRSGRFRACCIDCTYSCINLPDLDMAILLVNKQVYHEAARLFYTSYTFDFDTNIEACVPFLKDLTPYARNCIRGLGIVQRALPYVKDFDRCEWSEMCRYIHNNLQLSELSLGVVAGKPLFGWDKAQPFLRENFEEIAEQDEMSWVKDLTAIKGLQRVNVRSCVEHCPPPGSQAMEFFVNFSASIEDVFVEYLKDHMLPKVTTR